MQLSLSPTEALSPLTIRVSKDTLERIEVLAKLQGKPSACVIRELLNEALDKRAPELSVLETIREATRAVECQSLVTLESVITIKDTLLPALMLMFPEEFGAVAGKLSEHVKNCHRQRRQKAQDALAEARR